MKLALFLTSLFVTMNIFAQAWDDMNNPGRLRMANGETYDDYKKAFLFELDEKKESTAEVDFDSGKNWSGWHYPLRKGSGVLVPYFQTLEQAGELELKATLQHNFDTLSKLEQHQEWGGYCDALAGAAMKFSEPQAVTVDGVSYSKDMIEALLIQYIAMLRDAKLFKSDSVGEACLPEHSKGYDKKMKEQIQKRDGTFVDPCKGVNPGAFHIALKRMIGTQKAGFAIDRDNTFQKWNNLVVGYETKNLGEYQTDYKEASKGAVKKYRVKTKIHYTDYEAPGTAKKGRGKEAQKIVDMDVEYVLEVDKDNKIIGGKWLSKKYPDFMWYYGNKIPRPNDLKDEKLRKRWSLLEKLIDFDKVE